MAPDSPSRTEVAGEQRRDGRARGRVAAPGRRIVLEEVGAAAPAAPHTSALTFNLSQRRRDYFDSTGPATPAALCDLLAELVISKQT